jgi:hypothetical protein
VILSRYEIAAAELRKAAQARARAGVTPAHASAAASLAACEGDGDGQAEDAERRRDRVQHLADPYPDDSAAKAYRDAYEVPADYPQPVRVSPEDFRRGPVRPGHDAPSPGYDPPVTGIEGDCP